MGDDEMLDVVRTVAPALGIFAGAERAPAEHNGAGGLHQLVDDVLALRRRIEVPVVQARIGAVRPADEAVQRYRHVQQYSGHFGLLEMASGVAVGDAGGAEYSSVRPLESQQRRSGTVIRMQAAIAITGAHVVPVDGDPFDGTVLMHGGRIAAMGPAVTIPADAEVIEAAGRWLLPGFIDAHTHVGLHEEAEGWAGSDTNELTDPVTAAVRALDAINPADLGFDDALSGGITTVNVNPGSGNPIGGLTVAIHTTAGPLTRWCCAHRPG